MNFMYHYRSLPHNVVWNSTNLASTLVVIFSLQIKSHRNRCCFASLSPFRKKLGRCNVALVISLAILLVYLFTKIKPCGPSWLSIITTPLELWLVIIVALFLIPTFSLELGCLPLLFPKPLLGGAFKLGP